MSITLKKRQHKSNLLIFCAAHLKFLPQFLITILSIWLDRDVKVFTFLLGQELKPKTQNKNRAISEKIQDDYQSVTTSPLNIPALVLCLCYFCLHHLYSPSWHLTIHQPLASVAPRSQRRGIPWSHSCWSNPSPRPPLTDGGPCHFLLDCCKQKRCAHSGGS